MTTKRFKRAAPPVVALALLILTALVAVVAAVGVLRIGDDMGKGVGDLATHGKGLGDLATK